MPCLLQKNTFEVVFSLIPCDHNETLGGGSFMAAKKSSLEPFSVNSSIRVLSSHLTPLVEERFRIIRSIGEECIKDDELILLLSKKPQPICYDGFEPSGRMHIAQGIMKTINVNKLTSAGCKVKIWIADWFAKLNKKMGGDLKKIQIIGEYMIEIWKATGMDLDNVEFLWASKEIISRADEYLPLVFDIAEKNTIPRIMRCCQIMGRSEQDELSTSQLFYPCMQCADVFFLKADICQLGMDQRKVNVLAREYCDHIKRKNKPIILSHHMLPGFQQGQAKMSKSDPASSIFMEDEEEDVIVKIKRAYCPPKTVKENPCIEYVQYIIFPWFGEFEVERPEENGGNKIFKYFEEVVVDYETEKLHPEDLKAALSKSLNKILQPVRDHFKYDTKAKDLLRRVKAKEAEKEVEQGSPSSSDSPTNSLAVEERFKIIRSIGEKCVQEEELMLLLSEKPDPICYDGFEPSGRMHIAEGIMKTINVNKLTSAGCKVKIWIADWFAKLNKKMGGDMKKIQTIGEYMIEIWKATGMKLDRVEFVWASKEIISRANEYLPIVFDIAEKNKVPRIMRCCQIMGCSEQEELSTSQLFYPCMQCADVFFLKADICTLGMDQHEVSVLAHEYCNDISRKNKPIILSHHILPGLQQGQEKMSKTDPSSCIFMEDEEAEVNVKIKKAYCPQKIVEGNPCLEYVQYIIFPWFGEFKVERREENGGNKIFKSFEEVVNDYESDKLHPADLKPALSKALNMILQPVRDHFKANARAKDLLKKVKAYKIK